MEFPMLDSELVKIELGLDDELTLVPTAFLITGNGPALVMDEGVGWFFDEDGYEGKSNVMLDNGFTYLSRDITLEQAKRCISENTITLENLIGTYNDRYRANLSLWQNQVEGIEQDVLA